MRKQYSLRAVALAGVCLLPLAAVAQSFDLGTAAPAPAANQSKEYSGEVEIGGRYQSGTSPLFGRYTGNDSKGFGSLGGFHVKGGDAPSSGNTLYYEATGDNLDFQTNHRGPNTSYLPEADIDVKAGQQGTWAAHANYDAITYTGQTFYSPYLSSGVAAPGVQTGTAITSAAQANALSNGLVQQTAGTRRNIGSVDGNYTNGAWTITSGMRHEHKEGTLVQTLRSPNSGTAFAEPVNYDSDRFNVQGQFATRRLQLQLGYDYAKFTDNNTFFVAPYLSSGGFTSQYSLPPSNDAHYVTGRLGYNITPTTRLNTNFRYGIEMSEDAIGTGTATPTSPAVANFGSAANVALYNSNPTVGLMARTYDGGTSLVSHPITPLDLKAAYSVSGRETSNSPTSFYGTGGGDGSSAPLHYNVVGQSWTKQKALLEAGYRILPSTKLTMGYAFDTVDRNAGNAVLNAGDQVGYWVGHSNENTLSAKVTNNAIPDVNTAISYDHAVRTGNFEFLPGSTTSGAFYQAPRTADRFKARGDYAPNDQWSIGVNGKFETNSYHYPNGMTGTKRDANATIGPDVSYSPTKAVTTHLFYNYEQIYYVNMGNGAGSTNVAASTTASSGAVTPASTANGYGWSASTTDSVHTVGLGGDWKVTDRLKLGIDYTFSYGDVGYNLYNGIIVTNPGTASYVNNPTLSSVSSSMHSVKLHGEYELAENITLLAGYGFDLYKDNDWSYGWNPVILQNQSSATTPFYGLTSGESNSGYRVHSVYTAVRFKF